MKVSTAWLEELVALKVPMEEVARLLPLRTIGIKEEAEDFIELDMKGYNRADLLSMRGVAYEIAAITSSEPAFKEPEVADFVWNQQELPITRCEIKDATLCSLQGVAKIEGLKVGPSKDEWVKKLANSDMRSVNNVVDVTNLIMLEYGQPLHSFDASTIKDETIIVRTAKKGEEIATLDRKLRKLDSADIVLADTEKPIDVAGVMGGKDTETSDSTNTILLTASLFNPQMIMKTSRKLGLYSEASKRFQHGLTKTRLLQALNAAIKMYESLGGKLTAITIIGDLTDKTKTVELTQDKVNSLIGVEIKPADVISYLEKLHFTATRPGLAPQGLALQAQTWDVVVPYWRLDIEIEEDLIEEVARMYGYEKIPAKDLTGELPEKIDQSLFNLIYCLKTELAKTGLTEVQTYSFYSTKIIENCELKISKACDPPIFENLIRVANPISSETEYLRTHLWPNLVETVAKNIRQGFEDTAIFEVGKTYQLTKSGEIQEEYKLAIALLNGTDDPTRELYQILVNTPVLKEKVKLDNPIGESGGRFHPTRYLYLTVNDKPLGKIGEIHKRVTDKFGTEKRLAILEILLEPLL